MNNKRYEINTVLNFAYFFISLLIIFSSWILKIDFFIYNESDPLYFRLSNTKDIAEYFRTQEFNFLLIISLIVILYMIINSIFFLATRKKYLLSNTSKKINYFFIVSLMINFIVIMLCGLIVPWLTNSFILNSGDQVDIMPIVNHFYYLPIDILILIMLIEIFVVNLTHFLKSTLYYKSFIMHYTILPFAFLPLFFI